ncbi:hypothetical protein CHUAL_006628 [Chamberlinius hualienensis]
MSSLRKQLMKGKTPPLLPSLSSKGAAGRKGFGRQRDYSPTAWDKVYKCGNSGPVLVLLHGGGYSALTWALLSENIVKLVECQILAIDLRGHGSTITSDDNDLSAEVMANDVGAVVNNVFGSDNPSIILVGHSMGGAIAVHTAHQNLIPSLIGLVVIDVVEGTALDALISMQSFLRSRPSSFSSIENAIEWCLRSGQVRNIESAKVSMPGQIKNQSTDCLATLDVGKTPSNSTEVVESEEANRLNRGNSIQEEDEEEEEDIQSPKKSKSEDGHFKVPLSPGVDHPKYSWRIDLAKTERYWEGWFKGLSNMFLDCSPAKMLLLAGVDRLDKDLTIGQMQGKFQMQVLPQCGHAVHEDVPDKVADALASFMVRNKFAQPTESFHVMLPGC